MQLDDIVSQPLYNCTTLYKLHFMLTALHLKKITFLIRQCLLIKPNLYPHLIISVKQLYLTTVVMNTFIRPKTETYRQADRYIQMKT